MPDVLSTRSLRAAGAPQSRAGARAGLAAAAAVWAWLFLNDAVTRAPVGTAALVGRALLSVGTPADPRALATAAAPVWVDVVAFTAALCGLWAAAGVLVLRAVRAASRTPSLLVLTITLGIYLQFAVVVIAAVLAAEDLGRRVWLNVVAGNVVGSAALWWYVVHTHPEVRTEYPLAGDDPADGSGA